MAIVQYSYGRLTDSFTAIVSDNDPVTVTISIGKESLVIRVLFVPAPNPENRDMTLAWRTENGVVNFTFYEWNNVLGTTTTQTNTHIGTTSAGEPIYISLVHYRVGVANHLTMQFIVGLAVQG